MNCAECSHYHDLGDKLMCDAGLMEVTMVGNPRVVVEMPQCEKYVVKLPQYHPHKISLVSDPMDETGLSMKIDRRTKEYKEKHK